MPDVRLSHSPAADQAVVGWVEDVLARTLPPDFGRVLTISSDGPRRNRNRDASLCHVHLTWRKPLAEAIHNIRTEDGLALSLEPKSIPLERLSSMLDRVRSQNSAATPTVNSPVQLHIDSLVTNFAPTLSRTLAAMGVRDRRSPMALSSMTALGLALLDAYSHTAATHPASLPSLPMEDFYAMFHALGGGGGAGSGGGDAAGDADGEERTSGRVRHGAITPELAAAIGTNRNATRQARARRLLEHVSRAWPPARRGAGDVSAPLSAHGVAAVGSSPCTLVPNLAQLCAHLAGTAHVLAFGQVATNGCRCPLAARLDGAAADAEDDPSFGDVICNSEVFGEA